jgi:hypothetical protein
MLCLCEPTCPRCSAPHLPLRTNDVLILLDSNNITPPNLPLALFWSETKRSRAKSPSHPSHFQFGPRPYSVRPLIGPSQIRAKLLALAPNAPVRLQENSRAFRSIFTHTTHSHDSAGCRRYHHSIIRRRRRIYSPSVTRFFFAFIPSGDDTSSTSSPASGHPLRAKLRLQLQRPADRPPLRVRHPKVITNQYRALLLISRQAGRESMRA